MKCHHPTSSARPAQRPADGLLRPAQIVRDARSMGSRCGRCASTRVGGIARWRREIPPLHLQGRGTRRSLVEGLLLSPEEPLHRPSDGPPPQESLGRI
jgi:hypothetical protein